MCFRKCDNYSLVFNTRAHNPCFDHNVAGSISPGRTSMMCLWTRTSIPCHDHKVAGSSPVVRTLAVPHNRESPFHRHTRSKAWPWQKAMVHALQAWGLCISLHRQNQNDMSVDKNPQPVSWTHGCGPQSWQNQNGVSVDKTIYNVYPLSFVPLFSDVGVIWAIHFWATEELGWKLKRHNINTIINFNNTVIFLIYFDFCLYEVSFSCIFS